MVDLGLNGANNLVSLATMPSMEFWDKERDKAEKNVINVFVVQRVVEATLR